MAPKIATITSAKQYFEIYESNEKSVVRVVIEPVIARQFPQYSQFERVAGNYNDIKFYTVDVNEVEGLAEELGIRGAAVLKVFSFCEGQVGEFGTQNKVDANVTFRDSIEGVVLHLRSL